MLCTLILQHFIYFSSHLLNVQSRHHTPIINVFIHILFGHISLFLGIIITRNEIAECFFVAGMKMPRQKQLKGYKVYAGSQSKARVRHGGEVRGTWGSWSATTTAPCQSWRMTNAWNPRQGTVLLTEACLATSVTLDNCHRYVQRPTSQEIQYLIKLRTDSKNMCILNPDRSQHGTSIKFISIFLSKIITLRGISPKSVPLYYSNSTHSSSKLHKKFIKTIVKTS